jgi:hypothetical protein
MVSLAANRRMSIPARIGCGLTICALLFEPAFAQLQGQPGTGDNRAEIQALVTSYAETLGGCRAEDYADLFVPGTGYFASGFRGHMAGRQKLIELVRSERHCLAADNPAAAVRPGGNGAPTVEIRVEDGRVLGIADLGTAEYQDEYTKTPAGWRFVSRTVIIASEKAAGLDAAGLLSIHRLGGPDLGDFYETGLTRLLTSGVRAEVEGETVKGRVFLSGGGYRDETNERTAPGDWRVAQSTHVPPGQ